MLDACAEGVDQLMSRGRWLFIAALVAISAVGGVISSFGPFAPHPELSYSAFLADYQAGKVPQITQWRDRLEISDGGTLYLVVVPADRDLPTDLAAGRAATGVGFSRSGIPDNWLVATTPWVPGLLALAALVLWLRAVRDRRSGRGPESIAA